MHQTYKMTIVAQLMDYLESIAPLHYQESYDNAGLIVGSPLIQIKGVMTSLDCTEQVIDEAIKTGCNVVVSHHPIVFKGLKKLNGYTYIERVVMKAIKHDIALIAMHTNLDNVLQNGVNQKIAQKLDLQELNILATKDVDPLGNNIGAGVVGHLKESMSGLEFLDYVKSSMGLTAIKHTLIVDKAIQKVAICGGSGSFLLPVAKASGAQAYITSDFKYHEYFDAENQLMVLDIGHYESERFTIELLYDLISNKFSNFATHYTKINTNPVFYYI